MVLGKGEEELRAQLRSIRSFALDMDGTFYLGDRLLPGALTFIQRLRETDRHFVFLTNNSSKSREAYRSKLAGMGLTISGNELVTSGQATILYLQEHNPGKSVYLLGNPTLIREFEEAGVPLAEKEPDIVVTAFDTTLDYEKLCLVCDFVREGRPYLATHPDFNCPTETGFIPDIGAIHAFIHASTGRMPDKIIGKPYGDIMECAFRQTGCTAEQTVMVGDRLYTDIAVTAHVPELRSILVLTGESALGDLEACAVPPTMVFEGIREITPLL